MLPSSKGILAVTAVTAVIQHYGRFDVPESTTDYMFELYGVPRITDKINIERALLSLYKVALFLSNQIGRSLFDVKQNIILPCNLRNYGVTNTHEYNVYSFNPSKNK